MAGAFLTFPLCLLSTSGNEKQRLLLCLANALWRAGEANPDTDFAQHIQKGEYLGTKEHKTIACGAAVVGCQVGSYEVMAARMREGDEFIRAYQAKYGQDALVFVAASLFWGTHDNDDLPYRDFTTLCAINSVVGFKDVPIIVRRSMIIARALGYKKPSIMEAELKGRKKVTPMTLKQLRDSLDRLEKKNLLCRYQADRRTIYFATTLNWDQLREQVKQKLLDKGSMELRKRCNRADMEQRATEGPQEGHNGAASGATSGATKINAFQEMPFRKCPLIKEGQRSSEKESESENKQPPTLAEVEAFFESLWKSDKNKPRSAIWFSKYGNDPRWFEEDWKRQSTRWLSSQRSRE